MTRVLFVCLGNICRSPLAHGLLRDLIEERGLEGRIEVDSCGTSSFHNGEPPDANMRKVARRHGVDLSELRSRQLLDSDFFEFDLIIAMDENNEAVIRERWLPGSEATLVRFMDFVPEGRGRDVPDPYYGGLDGFERVYSIIHAGTEHVLDRALDMEPAAPPPTEAGVEKSAPPPQR